MKIEKNQKEKRNDERNELPEIYEGTKKKLQRKRRRKELLKIEWSKRTNAMNLEEIRDEITKYNAMQCEL